MLRILNPCVSKWERGDTYPDITPLPALASFYKTSVDTLIGMDKINDTQARTAIFTEGHKRLRADDNSGAASVYSEALKIFPNDESIISELALVLALDSDLTKLNQAVTLCERVLSGTPNEKVRHTTRAALCFLYLKVGGKERAIEAAQNLPHIRECRETVLAQFEKEMKTDEIDAYLESAFHSSTNKCPAS